MIDFVLSFPQTLMLIALSTIVIDIIQAATGAPRTPASMAFMICVMGGLGNMIGGFIAAFIFAEIISVGGLWLDLEWGYVFAFCFFIGMMFIRPEGLLARRS